MFVDRRPLGPWALACLVACALPCAVILVFIATPATFAASPTQAAAAAITPAAATPAAAPGPLLPMSAPPVGPSACLATGDGYLRAHLAGDIETQVDWPNSGTRCEGESRDKPPGVRLSFQRAHAGKTDLLFVFGITGVHEGKPTREAGVNLTIIVQGTSRIYGTLGDTRCTADSLKQRPLDKPGLYRVEARGFCTQPAHAVRGDGEVLVSTFEFAGSVAYEPPAGPPAADPPPKN
jgi:hypothetical protein